MLSCTLYVFCCRNDPACTASIIVLLLLLTSQWQLDKYKQTFDISLLLHHFDPIPTFVMPHLSHFMSHPFPHVHQIQTLNLTSQYCHVKLHSLLQYRNVLTGPSPLKAGKLHVASHWILMMSATTANWRFQNVRDCKLSYYIAHIWTWLRFSGKKRTLARTSKCLTQHLWYYIQISYAYRKDMMPQEQCVQFTRWIPHSIVMFCILKDIFCMGPLIEITCNGTLDDSDVDDDCIAHNLLANM
jgi:hypothetical protein